MQTATFEDKELMNVLSESQRILVKTFHRRKKKTIDLVESSTIEKLEKIATVITEGSGRKETDEQTRWRRLGFASENPKQELDRVGGFGLTVFHHFCTRHKELVLKVYFCPCQRGIHLD